jgi:hypothetical protein
VICISRSRSRSDSKKQLPEVSSMEEEEIAKT